MNPVKDAIDKAGSRLKLAHALGVTRQFVSRCLYLGWMPLKRAAQVEELYGIPRETLINPALKAFIAGEDE